MVVRLIACGAHDGAVDRVARSAGHRVDIHDGSVRVFVLLFVLVTVYQRREPIEQVRLVVVVRFLVVRGPVLSHVRHAMRERRPWAGEAQEHREQHGDQADGEGAASHHQANLGPVRRARPHTGR